MEAVPDTCIAPCKGVNIEDVSISQLQLQDGRFTTLGLTKCYFKRTKRLNCVLKLAYLSYTSRRAMLELNLNALYIICARNDEGEHGFVRGPLRGIPFFVKIVSSVPVNLAQLSD